MIRALIVRYYGSSEKTYRDIGRILGCFMIPPPARFSARICRRIKFCPSWYRKLFPLEGCGLWVCNEYQHLYRKNRNDQTTVCIVNNA